MRLSDDVLEAVKRAGIVAYFADRRVTKVWNSEKEMGEPIRFGGWYWHRVVKRRVINTDEEGPFRSRSAALRDAFIKLQLRIDK